MNLVSYKCPQCGAPLKFKSETQKWDCDFCLGSFDVKTLESMLEQSREKTEMQEVDENTVLEAEPSDDYSKQVRVYSCPSCGGQVLADEHTAATFCVFCGNPAIVEQNLSGSFKPAKVIPFTKTKEDAMRAFKSFCRKKPLLPRYFHSQTNIDKITGVYVPFWLFSCKTLSNIHVDARRTSTWSDSEYRYTKTDYYEVFRSGKLEFFKVPADGSSKMPDDFMDSLEPYDYKGLKDFSMAYLSGYLADKYDQDDKKIFPRVKTRMQQTAVDQLKEYIHGYDFSNVTSSNTDFQNTDAQYALLPVWMLNTSYKGKQYLYAMNGQTGKFVGKMPISPLRAWAWFGSVSAAILTILTIGGWIF